MNMPKDPERLIQELEPAVGALAWMPVEMWHLWVLWVLEVLREHAEDKQEYEEFLARLALTLGARVEIKSQWL